MAITLWYVDPAINADSGTGTIGDPFGDLQYALNTVTRDTVNGDQFNIKAGTAEVLAGPLTLATYGTPAEGSPLILRGYTTVANDGGRAEIDCGGFTMWASSAYFYISMLWLTLHNFGNSNGIDLLSRPGCVLAFCDVSRGASNPTTKSLVRVHTVIGCYVHDAGIAGSGIQGPTLAYGNYVRDCTSNIGIAPNAMGAYIGNNIVYNCYNGISRSSDLLTIIGNIVVGVAGSNYGIGAAASVHTGAIINNNIVCGYNGVGGVGIGYATSRLAGYNAFYNNATNSDGSSIDIDLTANDVSLAADPFTNAANGDFSLTAAAKAALADKGWPLSYLGAHANTDPHITIGAIQQALATGGGGFPKIASVLGRTRM